MLNLTEQLTRYTGPASTVLAVTQATRLEDRQKPSLQFLQIHFIEYKVPRMVFQGHVYKVLTQVSRTSLRPHRPLKSANDLTNEDKDEKQSGHTCCYVEHDADVVGKLIRVVDVGYRDSRDQEPKGISKLQKTERTNCSIIVQEATYTLNTLLIRIIIPDFCSFLEHKQGLFSFLRHHRDLSFASQFNSCTFMTALSINPIEKIIVGVLNASWLLSSCKLLKNCSYTPISKIE